MFDISTSIFRIYYHAIQDARLPRSGQTTSRARPSYQAVLEAIVVLPCGNFYSGVKRVTLYHWETHLARPAYSTMHHIASSARRLVVWKKESEVTLPSELLGTSPRLHKCAAKLHHSLLLPVLPIQAALTILPLWNTAFSNVHNTAPLPECKHVALTPLSPPSNATSHTSVHIRYPYTSPNKRRTQRPPCICRTSFSDADSRGQTQVGDFVV
jgi:hypothetical protein